MSLFVDLLVFFCSGAALTAQCFLIASCEILNLNNGGPRMGGYGLFFVDVPELESEQCIKTMEIDEIFGRWGGDFAWEPREDDLLVAAQIGSGVAVAFGFISLVTVFCKSCCCPLPCSQLLTDISGLAIQAGLAMVYLLWISDGCKFYDCEYGQGLSFLIAAQALWAISSCLSRCMRPSAAERKKIEIEQEEAAR